MKEIFMRKAIFSAVGASFIVALTFMPTLASAEHRYHRDWDDGPRFGVYVGPRYHRDWDDRYAYDYQPYWRHHRHHDDDDD
jgi:hypothetical protein